MKRKLLLGGAFVTFVGLGVGLAIHFSLAGKSGKETPTLKQREITKEMTQERGSRPSESRLPDGKKQVEDPAQALFIARESLARVEREMAVAQSDSDRARLETKKKLIEKAITNLTSR